MIAPVADRRTWREVGDPLVPATGSGALDGETVAVKDLFAVEGHHVGAGNPAWLAQADVQTRHARAVEQLLGSGASVAGIAQTDEFAYSLAGDNAHHGSPPNARAPGRLSGGSSSGSASAVATGQVTIGLGTDTGGSIRVPSSYQGLWGIRTTHGAVAVDGLMPLAPSFDTVGWMTRSAGLLAAVAGVLLPPDTAVPNEVVTSDALTRLAHPEVADVVTGIGASPVDWPLAPMSGWLAAMQARQAWEAWQVHGPWLAGRLDTLGPDVRRRFERAASLSDEVGEAAAEEVARARETIRTLLGDRVLLLPSASSVAPVVGDAAGLDAVRQATMQLTCLAGIAGLPAVSVPLTTSGGLPAGACLVGPAGSDRALIALTATIDGV